MYYFQFTAVYFISVFKKQTKNCKMRIVFVRFQQFESGVFST